MIRIIQNSLTARKFENMDAEENIPIHGSKTIN